MDNIIILLQDLKKDILFDTIDVTSEEFYIYLYHVIQTILETPKNNEIIFETINCLSYYLLKISDLDKIQTIQKICHKFLEKSYLNNNYYRSPDFIIKYKHFPHSYQDLFLDDNTKKKVII